MTLPSGTETVPQRQREVFYCNKLRWKPEEESEGHVRLHTGGGLQGGVGAGGLAQGCWAQPWNAE